MKPDWKDAPDGAMFLAQDGNGDWFWYADKPVFGRNGSWSSAGMLWIAGEQTPPAAETLEERPQ